MNNHTFRVYNDTLDPILWDENDNLRSEIANKLLKTAMEFYESLEIKPKLHDIHLLGSAASFNYNNKSDVDIHLIIDFDELEMDGDSAKKYMDALKAHWNDVHDIHIKGKNVEVYIQDVDEINHANGIYSLMNHHWVKRPTKDQNVIIDKESIKEKYYDYVYKIKTLEQSKEDPKVKVEKISNLIQDIHDARKTGLEASGELGVENVTFKALRSKGYIERLKKLKDRLYDEMLSVQQEIKI